MRKPTIHRDETSAPANLRRCAIYARTAIEIAGRPPLAALDAQRVAMRFQDVGVSLAVAAESLATLCARAAELAPPGGTGP